MGSIPASAPFYSPRARWALVLLLATSNSRGIASFCVFAPRATKDIEKLASTSLRHPPALQVQCLERPLVERHFPSRIEELSLSLM